MLVALKCDLRESPESVEKLVATGDRPLTYQDGVQVAKRIKATRYLECSAKMNRGVNEAFDETAKVAILSKARGKDYSQHRGCVIC